MELLSLPGDVRERVEARAEAYLDERLSEGRLPSHYITAVHRILKDEANLPVPFEELRRGCNQVGRELGIRGDLWWGKSILVIAAAYVVFESGWAPLMITAPAALAVGAVLTWLLRVFDVDDIATVRRLLGRPSGAA